MSSRMVTITMEEYNNLKNMNTSCNIEINNQPFLEKEVMKLRLIIMIMKDEKKFKHDKIVVPRIGTFYLSELKKDCEEII